MPYNIYLPKDYDADKAKTIHGRLHRRCQRQHQRSQGRPLSGNGAIVWATPEEQAKHPAIVLAPQYTEDLIRSIGMMTTDTHQWTRA